mgnify:CR=1 FL=1
MSRHTARRRALEILFSREFHDTNDIQYSETEILGYAEDEKEPIESAATVETVTADCLDEHAVPFVSENEVLVKWLKTTAKTTRPLTVNTLCPPFPSMAKN